MSTPTRHYVSIREAADYWSVSTKTIRRCINRGELTGYYPCGRTLRLDLNELEAIAQANATRKVA
ncbi:MAG: helix-turn-helix domain-containing protein [Corynebacteriales bacterium]|nr:helix-turn-helix domain-containing protein [Mycobacteriales bacterium]